MTEMSCTQRAARRQPKKYSTAPAMFSTSQVSQQRIPSGLFQQQLVCTSSPSGGEVSIHQPPMITGSRCSNVCASGITRFEKEKVSYTWTVSGINSWPEDTYGIASTSFRHPNSSEWCMVLMKQLDTLSLCFWLRASKDPFRGTLQAHLVFGRGEKREVYPSEYCTLKGGEKSKLKPVSSFISGAEGTVNPTDTLTFECEIRNMCIVWEELPRAPASEPQPGLAKDLGELLNSEEFSDFILHAGDVQLKAHKAVLSARSPVFARMLRQDMREARENFVRIVDVEPEVVREALRYMYTGCAPALEEMARGLLVFADRYELCELKSKCELELARRLTVDNAAATAVFAVVNSCDALQKSAVAFIRRHLEQVMGTPGWGEALRDADSVEKISCLIASGSESKSSEEPVKNNTK